MVTSNFVSIVVRGVPKAAHIIGIAVTHSIEFHFTPLPFDDYEIQIKPEAKHLFQDC